jgi:hypothetical protein
MPLDYHTVETVDGATPTNRTDRVILGFLPGFPSAAAAGEGDAVQVTVSGLTLPSVFSVHALPSQPAIVSVGSKSNSGFTVTLTPPSSSITLAAGSVDITIVA